MEKIWLGGNRCFLLSAEFFQKPCYHTLNIATISYILWWGSLAAYFPHLMMVAFFNGRSLHTFRNSYSLHEIEK